MDQLELIDCVSSAGIDSLRGFSYQIKVFLLYLSKIKDNERMGYETIDDVSIQKLNESNFDEKCNGYMSIKTESNTYTAIQVKRTTITVDVAKGILLNWLLLKDRGDVEEYIVFTEKDYKNTDSIFDINFDDFFDEIQNSTKKRSDALIMRVKKLHEQDLEPVRNLAQSILDSFQSFGSDLDVLFTHGLFVINESTQSSFERILSFEGLFSSSRTLQIISKRNRRIEIQQA